MAKDSLVVDHCGDPYEWRIIWYIAEIQDHGAIIGDGVEGKLDEPIFVGPAASENAKAERVNDVATWTASTSPDVERDKSGYYWPSKACATAALRLIKAQVKSKFSDVPWPEWALSAQAAGWKPPKGWQP